MAKFFIDRPVFAWVIAIILMIAGVLTLTGLQIERYPNIAPPQVGVSAFYPGASAHPFQVGATTTDGGPRLV